ncbi:hypothetical protein [Nocardiopsis valliformis]|uniref:hypothetical protein n=1 Tax=Nocardiopsis valliformis TaxID=239974 RepID=UPI0003476526|nr:hypothetical protein [Nocardiopsis valliformis]
MPDLFQATENLKRSRGSRSRLVADREFIEVITYATADEILAVLDYEFRHDWLVMPAWAMNLAFRLACLQRPDDPVLLREASVALLLVGPDWDEHAEALERRADQLEGSDEPCERG